MSSDDSWSTSLARDTQRRVDAVARSPGAYAARNVSFRSGSDLGQECELIPVVPPSGDFSIDNFHHAHAGEFHATVRGRSAEKLSLVRRDRPPSWRTTISGVRDSLFDGESNIGKCLAQTEKQRAKLFHVDLSVLLDLAVTDRIR